MERKVKQKEELVEAQKRLDKEAQDPNPKIEEVLQEEIKEVVCVLDKDMEEVEGEQVLYWRSVCRELSAHAGESYSFGEFGKLFHGP